MRSLQHLTRRNSVCTVVVNAAVGSRSQIAQHCRRVDDQASVFSSTLGKPALGKHFPRLIDTSIFLSTLPRSREDADIAYNHGHGPKSFAQVGVVEVLQDRRGTREGRWSFFEILAGTEFVNVTS